MRGKYFILVFLFLFHNLLQAQPAFVKVLDNMLAQPDYKNAQIGILLAETETGNVLYELNSERLMIPASVLKLITTAAALEILGADYRFQTHVGYRGKIENGVLKGDLIIIGGGDPALGSEYFSAHYFSPHFMDVWAKAIRAAGIRRVEGQLITDNSLYDKERIPPTWIWEDMGNYYGAGTSALSVYDNLTRITFQSPPDAGMFTRILSVSPQLRELSWRNEVLSSNITRDLAYVFGSPIDNHRIIRGTIPKNRSAFTIKASNPCPEKLLAEDFLRHLAAEGIFVSGDLKVENSNPQEFRRITSYDSPALSEIVKAVNQESVNLFAEHLVKQIASERTGLGDRVAGLKIISDFWAGQGLNINQLFMEDGSGLSHFNAVTPQFILGVLRYMKKTGMNSEVFFESLPAAGQGTLHVFNPAHFPEKSFRLKSGSMKRIRCYAGYVETRNGNEYAMIFFINHFSGTHVSLISELQKVFSEIMKE